MYINYLAVIVAAIASMIIGSLWYSPVLFMKPWMRLLKIQKNDMNGPGKAMLGAAVTSLVMSYILAHFVNYVGATTAGTGAILGVWIWLGFMATMGIYQVFFEGRPFKLFLINTSNQLVTIVVMSVILAVWR